MRQTLSVVVSWLAPWLESKAVMRFVQVLDDAVELIQRVGALGLLGPARHGVAQVAEVAHLRAHALMHPLVVAAAAVRLVQDASLRRFLGPNRARKPVEKRANPGF